jgi:hypothetical protein
MKDYRAGEFYIKDIMMSSYQFRAISREPDVHVDGESG